MLHKYTILKMTEIILDIIKFSAPALIVFLTVYTMLTKQAKKEERIRIFELKKKHSQESLPIRLQAYERLTLFLYRISPENLLPRTQDTSMNVKTFSILLLQTIKSEFEHNITQQVYVSTATWACVAQYRIALENFIREKATELNPEEPGFKLAEAILTSLMDDPQLLSQNTAAAQIKKEVKQMFI